MPGGGLSRRRTRPRDADHFAILGVALVVGVALGLRFFLVPPHHVMYLDEPWYAEAACNLARRGHLVLCEETWSGSACLPYGKALGWPVFLSALTKLVGCHTTIGIEANRVLGVLTVLLVALATRCAGGRWWQGAFAAALLAVDPVHVEWSATGETNVAAAAALLAGLCGALVFVSNSRWRGAVLAVSGLALSTAIRPESLVPAMVAGAFVARAARASLARRLLVAGSIGLVGAAAALSGTRLWEMNQSISGGAFLSLGNVLVHGLLLARTEALAIHGVLLSLAVGGAVAHLRGERSSRIWLLFCCGLSAALVVLAYDRFHERMLLEATVALLPVSAFFFDWLPSTAQVGRASVAVRPLGACIVSLLLLALWWHALVSVSVPPETQVLETRIASRAARVPAGADALFIAEQPTVLAAAGVARVMSTRRALSDDAQLTRALGAGQPVYFLCDMNCEQGFGGSPTPPLCRSVLERFSLLPVAEERLHGRAYVLYRVTGLTRDGSAVPTCPRSNPG